MRYSVGLAINEGPPVTVSATCWPAGVEPHFSTYAMSRSFMRDKLLALVLTQNEPLEAAVNAALMRVAEKLFLKEKIANPQNGDPPFRLILPLKYKKHRFKYPHEAVRSHWLITASKRALEEWTTNHG